MIRRALIAVCLLSLIATPALATPIFTEDFEDGDADGWAPSGDEVRLTEYAGNTSLRLSGQAAAVRAVSTRGFTDVQIAAALAASDLEPGEHCLVEASSDGGRTWREVLRVEDSRDDAVALHTGVIRAAGFNNAERILIGARVAGNAANDQCWIDNVRIAGAAIAASPARARLTHDFLMGAAALSEPVPMSEFAPSANARAPSHEFRGALAFDPEMTGFRIIQDTFGYDSDPDLRLRAPPAFDFEFIQAGDRLVPVQRGPIPSGRPSWEFALEPGRVWDEPDDNRLTRAALPFALIETSANCTHNGVLTFVFGEDREISRVAWQIASETCAYLQFDAWGVAAATYRPGSAYAEAIIAADAREVAALQR